MVDVLTKFIVINLNDHVAVLETRLVGGCAGQYAMDEDAGRLVMDRPLDAQETAPDPPFSEILNHRLLEDRATARAFGERGRELVVAEASQDVHMGRMLEIYRQVVAN